MCVSSLRSGSAPITISYISGLAQPPTRNKWIWIVYGGLTATSQQMLTCPAESSPKWWNKSDLGINWNDDRRLQVKIPIFLRWTVGPPYFFYCFIPNHTKSLQSTGCFFGWVSSGDFYGLLFYCLNPQNLLDSPSLFSADDRERGRINGWRGGKFQRWVNPQAKRAGHGMGICGFFWVKNGICWDYTTAQSNC